VSSPESTGPGPSTTQPSVNVGATVTGFDPNTTYYVRVRAFAGPEESSDYSVAVKVTTPGETESDTATLMQNWLVEQQIGFQNTAALVPQLGNTELNTDDRRRLNGSGVRRYGFIEKTADIARDFPQIWPRLVEDTGKLHELVEEIEVFRNLLIWFRVSSRVVQDLLLIAGDDAFRLAGAYYAAAQDGARRKNPEAQKVYEMLKLFWRKKRRKPKEPMPPEETRNAPRESCRTARKTGR